jgi:hypothetical protein
MKLQQMNSTRDHDKKSSGKKLPHLAKVVSQWTQSLQFVGWSQWLQWLQARRCGLYIGRRQHDKSITTSWQRHYLKLANELTPKFLHDDCHCNQSVDSGVRCDQTCARPRMYNATHPFIGSLQSIIVNDIVIVVESWLHPPSCSSRA